MPDTLSKLLPRVAATLRQNSRTSFGHGRNSNVSLTIFVLPARTLVEDVRTMELVEEKVAEKEAFLQELLPEWEEQRALESTEKRRLDEANAHLNSLFAKQG